MYLNNKLSVYNYMSQSVVNNGLTSCNSVTYFFHHKYFCTVGPSPAKK